MVIAVFGSRGCFGARCDSTIILGLVLSMLMVLGLNWNTCLVLLTTNGNGMRADESDVADDGRPFRRLRARRFLAKV